MGYPKMGRCRGRRTGTPATMNMTLRDLDALVPLSLLPGIPGRQGLHVVILLAFRGLS